MKYGLKGKAVKICLENIKVKYPYLMISMNMKKMKYETHTLLN